MISSILFYKFFPLEKNQVDLFRLWQWELCSRLELKGRLIVSTHGINGTLGGSEKNLKAYLKACKTNPLMGRVEAKWSRNLETVPFPKLSVKVREELVTFGWPELEVNGDGIVDGGKHLDPKALRALLEEISVKTGKPVNEILGSEVLFLDGRNAYEYRLGHFKNALDPGVANAKQFEPFIQSGALDHWRDKPIVSYCTGGIRCEILTPLLKKHGFSEVYQIDGGIVKYLERTNNEDGLWEGSVYTFDAREKLWESRGPVIGKCCRCSASTDVNRNCRPCGEQVLICTACWAGEQACSACVVRD